MTSLEMENFIETLLNADQLKNLNEITPEPESMEVIKTKSQVIVATHGPIRRYRTVKTVKYDLKPISKPIDDAKEDEDRPLRLECPHCHYRNEKRFIIADVFECAMCNQLFALSDPVRRYKTAKEMGYNKYQKYCTECHQLISHEWYMLRHGERQCSGCASLENRSIANAIIRKQEAEKHKNQLIARK